MRFITSQCIETFILAKNIIMRFLLVMFCCVCMLSCGSDDNNESDPVICPTIAFPAFEIQITDAGTGIPLSDVMITVREGDTFEEILEESSGIPGTYLGVFEREGSYILVIERTNFQTIITESITVGRLDDECNTLDTQELFFSLSEL